MQDSGSENNIGAVEQKRQIVKPEIYGASVASEKHSGKNEDAAFILGKRAVGIIDGMGGVAGGERAAQLAKNSLCQSLEQMNSSLSLPDSENGVRQALVDANRVVFQQGQAEKNIMGATGSVLYIWEGSKRERYAIVGNVGDSRVYILRNNILQQITLDDNAVRKNTANEQEARELQWKLNNTIDPKKQLTPMEQILFGKRNEIVQRLGISSIEPRINTIKLLALDKLLVCSDGISDNLTDIEIQEIMEKSKTDKDIVDKLISESKKRSSSNHPRAKPDDMTAIVVSENLKKPATIEDIPLAKNSQQLIDIINEMGGVQGADRYFASSDLTQIINNVLAGRAPSDSITRTGGLRAKVLEIIEANKTRK